MAVVYSYTDSNGNPTTNTKEIVTQEVELLAYAYIEKNGKRPSKELIDSWVHESLTAMGWYDND